MELLEAIAMLRRLWVSLVYQTKVHEYKYHICGSRSEYGSDLEHRTGIAEVMGSNPVEALIFFQASSFQLLKLENLLR